ncbi:MAG: hypothetical protein US42_C0005G0023 [Candidatus Magasanikbacteria bacterium GW2011_GWC2_37_14]|uniref:Uncharacterized protein n=1 Tax=Candidatus Magasanikbacteria bacterium GW2011_GWC2_37_14 TaxID=1619046 RepID=A0A0G0G9M5_9BACT|nr:MAG: hypothetical protein US42_C0005G0023 [Candidatus Magasanikbacteria bacterium GW2011_GWC2_37_14]
MPEEKSPASAKATAGKENLYTASEMKKVLQNAEMALWLDSYNNIFSDFDPRPFAERALSDDFILEMKKVARDRGKDSYELKFLLAPETRNHHQEEVIKERLHHFFIEQHHQYIKERKGIIARGFLFVILGVVFMSVASFLLTFFANEKFLFNFLVILLEPAGWFLFWEGLSHAMYKSEQVNPEIKFYHKMAHSKIEFISY